MHELSIAQSIVSQIADRLGSTRVVTVTLEIGKISGIVVSSVRFCFDLVASGTIHDGASLVVLEPVGRAICHACSEEFTTTDPIVLCPSCGTASVDVVAGRELRIKSVEVMTCAEPADAPKP
ncbi:hydrogenase maturation nickel metallochaperone HypA [Kibdelosporangium philippinense]|uniref:Hydrogenase maturation factor HypA n=1 Tax=Kibdelosporangium philippinense TaxID=211113 RepID=A0ABS8ZGZ1_9PSEU|nr:hydrogenase maturation nickel metallochaperone HypA [Kibdelosporangium philippinense]MCE7006827.1 hydrogenase maturation nickel metallochaperone HypA [Kibdelosporangium philippinense]